MCENFQTSWTSLSLLYTLSDYQGPIALTAAVEDDRLKPKGKIDIASGILFFFFFFFFKSQLLGVCSGIGRLPPLLLLSTLIRLETSTHISDTSEEEKKNLL